MWKVLRDYRGGIEPEIIQPVDVDASDSSRASSSQSKRIRSLGAPAVLLSLAMQGVFHGFKDTKSPLYATGFMLLAVTFGVTFAASMAGHGWDQHKWLHFNTFCVTLVASMAARMGCISGLLATSLLADGLAGNI
ncbi:MATE efflux family protein FRD3 [Abeliophyllum distichum]|uniref:MATE efflux family protein FRD3 n=1 Tax=Abeliophyllum distichum TaxID=126358 RepID=A0ABD1UJU4_9LAMI